MRDRATLAQDAQRIRAIVRLGHCTPTFGGHSPACLRDGRYCSGHPESHRTLQAARHPSR